MALAYLLDPCQQFQNRAGVNNVDGYFEVFYNGTDDRAPVYSDFNKTLASQPVRIDNNGRCVMIVDSSKAYRVEMREPNGALVFTQYPVWVQPRGGSQGYTAGFGITISDLDDIAVDTDVIQKKLTAGDNIQIDPETDTISATDTTYTAGDNVSISEQNVISATDTKYTAGQNITISGQNVISSTDTTYTAGANVEINGNVISATDTTYTAGANVQINGNVISATDTTYTAGANVQINGNVISSTDTNTHRPIQVEGTQCLGDNVNPLNLKGGNNVSVSANGGDVTISSTNTTYTAGNGLNLNGTEFSADTSVLQEKLTAGSNVQINGNTISATDTTYTAGPNIDILNGVVSTEKVVVAQGNNVTITSSSDSSTRTITYNVSATDTTYNVFNTTTDGLVPKSGANTDKFLKGDGTWGSPLTSVTATAPLAGTGTSADPLVLRISHGLSLVQPAGGTTALQVTNPVPPPDSTDSGKFLQCTDALGNLDWVTVSTTATGVQEIVTLSSSYSDVVSIITNHNEPVLSVSDSNGAALYRRVFFGLITTPPNPVTAVRFARVAGSIYQMYTIDNSTGNWAYTEVPLTKHSHTAELYFYNTDDGDHYHIRNIQNYAVNHVTVENHSADICSILVEAPTLGTNEEYDYNIVFDCVNSSGGCNVSVQGVSPEIETKWEVDYNAVPLKTFAEDITNCYVQFDNSFGYQINVLGRAWKLQRF